MKIRRDHQPWILAVIALTFGIVGFTHGCATRSVSPKLIAARTVTVLELIEIAQDSLIAAEAAGLIDEATTRAALIRIGDGLRHARTLRPILEGWDQLSDPDEKATRLDQARAILFTLSQVLAAIAVESDHMATVDDALVAANALFLQVSDLRGDQ